MKNNGGVAWSPILGQGNFHKATRFGKVTWMAPGAPVAALADAGPAPVVLGVQEGGVRMMPTPRARMPLQAAPPSPPQ